jgi:pimeloyl-ACP methyl ester carboxylesterase
MTSRISTSPTRSLAYEAKGDGIPLLAFHGAYSSRVEVREFLEPMVADRPIRRIYVDLPGHGDSRPSSGLKTPDDVLDLVDLLLAEEVPDGPFLLLGHSFGGHVARAVAARHPSRVAGLALLCPVVPAMDGSDAEGGVVADDGASAELSDDERTAFEEYFVVRTAETVERFRRAVQPATGETDAETLDRAIDIGPHAIDPDTVLVDAPVVIITGRRDRWVGWRQQQRVGDRYPHATVVTVADAGHALPHERPQLVSALLADWLSRAGIGAL